MSEGGCLGGEDGETETHPRELSPVSAFPVTGDSETVRENPCQGNASTSDTSPTRRGSHSLHLENVLGGRRGGEKVTNTSF